MIPLEQARERQPFEFPTIGKGFYLPADYITNQHIEDWNVTTASGKQLRAADIEKRTGVKRRFVEYHKTTEDMAQRAALFAINGFKEPIDVVFASSSYPTGNHISSTVAKRLHLEPQFALDIHAACSGFSRGLSFIKEHERKFHGKRVLFVASEKYSPTLADLRIDGIAKDPSMAQTIFSDGAYAMTFTYGRDLEVLSALDYRFPKDISQNLKMPVDLTLAQAPFIAEPIPTSKSGLFEQNGAEVYTAVRNGIPPLVDQTIDRAGLKPTDIRLVIPHQGSKHVVTTLAHQLPDLQVLEDYENGNFSSASVMKGLYKAIQERKVESGDNVVLAGFGAGLFASTVVIQLH